MTAINEAGLDHAAMAEDLLTQAASSLAAVERADAGMDALLAVHGELVNDVPEYDEFRRSKARAAKVAEMAIDAALVHATLACAPRTLAAASGFGGYIEATEDPTVVNVGSRVVYLLPDEPRHVRNGHRFMGSDSFGTVSQIVADNEALVDFDDIGQQRIPVEQLRVVLGA